MVTRILEEEVVVVGHLAQPYMRQAMAVLESSLLDIY